MDEDIELIFEKIKDVYTQKRIGKEYLEKQ